MAWNRWYSLKSYLTTALWTVPFFALVAGRLVKFLAEMLGTWMVGQGFYDLETGFLAMDAAEANAFLDRTFTMNLSFLVFTFGSLLVAIQVAGGQYTPRIIATTLLRDNVIRWITGLFIFALIWANRTMVQVTADLVPQFQIFLSAVLSVVSLIAFLLLIDYSAKLLRPVSLVASVGRHGLAVIEDLYRRPTDGAESVVAPAEKQGWRLSRLLSNKPDFAAQTSRRRGPPERTIHYLGDSGIVLALNVKLLVETARTTACLIEFVPQIGDFVAHGDPLFHVYGNAAAVDERSLRTLVAFGSERTMEQDPMFAFRILVDIALKALSKAINDPTTAVLAIDQLHRLLRLVGLRSLHGEEILDAQGSARLIFRTPNWEDFVHIAFREIRQCGAGSLQIARRLRAMIENLTATLPPHRHGALLAELALLDRAVSREHPFAEDVALARIGDAQGLGGASSSRLTKQV